MSQTLSEARIAAALNTQSFGRSLRILEQTGSTNDDARADALSGAAPGHVVLADEQSSGRGSQGSAWQSPRGQDLYVSIVTRPAVSLHSLPPLTLAVGVGVAHAVEEIMRAQAGASDALRAQVKWPNDVWLDRKKVAGVLVEASTIGAETSAVIIGIGLNVNRVAFDEALCGQASSLRLSGPHRTELDRERALCTLLAAVERWVDVFSHSGPEAIALAIDERLALRGARVTLGTSEGTLLGVASSGAVRLQAPTGEVAEHISGRLQAVC